MFERIGSGEGGVVTVHIDGQEVVVPEKISIAAALLLQDDSTFRLSPVSGEPRAPFCMIGNCFECLVTVDEKRNQQSCLVEVEDQMRIRRQIGPVSERRGGACDV